MELLIVHFKNPLRLRALASWRKNGIPLITQQTFKGSIQRRNISMFRKNISDPSH